MIVSRKVQDRIDAGDWKGAYALMPAPKARKPIERKKSPVLFTHPSLVRKGVNKIKQVEQKPRKIAARKRRTASEERAREQRIYGTPEHRAWLHQQPCCITGRRGNKHDPIVAAHTKGDGGTGYKASARFQVPMLYTLHCELHDHGPETFERKYRVSLVALAADCWRAWGARCEALGGTA